MYLGLRDFSIQPEDEQSLDNDGMTYILYRERTEPLCKLELLCLFITSFDFRTDFAVTEEWQQQQQLQQQQTERNNNNKILLLKTHTISWLRCPCHLHLHTAVCPHWICWYSGLSHIATRETLSSSVIFCHWTPVLHDHQSLSALSFAGSSFRP